MAAALACALFLVWQWKLDHAFTQRWTQSLPLLVGFLPAWLGACIGGWRSRWTAAIVAVESLLLLVATVFWVKGNSEPIGHFLETICLGVSGFCLWWVWSWVAGRGRPMRVVLRCTVTLLLVAPIGLSVASWIGCPVHLGGRVIVFPSWIRNLPVPCRKDLYLCALNQSDVPPLRLVLQRLHYDELSWQVVSCLEEPVFGVGGWEGFFGLANAISEGQLPPEVFGRLVPYWWPGGAQPQFLCFQREIDRSDYPFFIAESFVVVNPLGRMIYIMSVLQ